ncbi:hypothetical protein EDB85DRAFT_1889438 [Lactarius pseudohatsudake]|nr:hypothetical protein EDB85DRAFT_1889438 [Lactarius pseudohatsudake]
MVTQAKVSQIPVVTGQGCDVARGACCVAVASWWTGVGGVARDGSGGAGVMTWHAWRSGVAADWRGWSGTGWRRRGWGRDVACVACRVAVASGRVDGRESWRSRGLAQGEIATGLDAGVVVAWRSWGGTS